MAAAVPFVAKMVFSAVVSRVVTGITGNELIGMAAGLGAGYATGAFGGSESTAAATTTEAAAPEVLSGGAEATTGAQTSSLYGGVDYTQNVGTGGASGAEGLYGGVDYTENIGSAGGASTGTTAAEGVGGWIEKNPVKSQMGFGLLQGAAQQKMTEDRLEEESQRRRAEEEERYWREHQAIDPSKIRSLDPINRGLIEGGYQPPGARVSSDLPNYQQLLDRYRRR